MRKATGTGVSLSVLTYFKPQSIGFETCHKPTLIHTVTVCMLSFIVTGKNDKVQNYYPLTYILVLEIVPKETRAFLLLHSDSRPNILHTHARTPAYG